MDEVGASFVGRFANHCPVDPTDLRVSYDGNAEVIANSKDTAERFSRVSVILGKSIAVGLCTCLIQTHDNSPVERHSLSGKKVLSL